MTSVPWVDDDEEVKASAVRWKGRSLINFAAGRSRVRALPVVIHLLPEGIGWFSSDASLFDELKLLLRERVVAATSNGDKDPEAPKSRKRARKEEGPDTAAAAAGSRSSAGSGQGKLPGGRDNGPEFRHLPLSESTLLVWVYRFDRDDPYRPVPNQAALQFAPKAAKTSSSSSSSSSSSAVVPAAAAAQEALDVEAIGRRSGAADGTTVGAQGGPRDTGLLAWLWGGGTDGGPGDGGGGGGQRGGVRQHFIGNASCQGKPPGERRATAGGREEEDEDIQRAIQLSLATASGADGGVEESKG
eukprot:g10438.t1